MRPGLLWVALGLALTLGSFTYALLGGGERFRIALGAIVVGLVLIAMHARERRAAAMSPVRTTFSSLAEEAEYYREVEMNGPAARRTEARVRLARLYAESGALEHAEDYYRMLVRDGVLDPDLLKELAAVYRRQGRSKDAEDLERDARQIRAQVRWS